jgi:Lar family restriction alleviation protein
MDIELSSCPFCGGEAELGVNPGIGMTVQFGRCLDCGAEGPISGDSEGAADGWNERIFATPADAKPNADLLVALRDLLTVIETDSLIPESVSYMRQARAAVAKAIEPQS